ncbi:antibiotic biosynthesis monooxygenase [Leeuwenhoekiella marinoflava]|uniref:antibiotic biosynthesis monooxygenase n=1 Tax=Leeuwenhoekiella marinoflava TaxID=988 RepID=UPI003002E9D8
MQNTYYVIVRFNIQQEQFQTLHSLITAFFEQEVHAAPGFISSQILVSEDKTLVTNYATWESKETFDTFAEEVVPKSEISKKIADFNPVRETFYEFEYLEKSTS